MRQKIAKTLFHTIIGIVMMVWLGSLTGCTPRQVPYFQGSFDTAQYVSLRPREIVVQKNDILSIIVSSDDALASALYNQPLTTTPVGGLSASGYLVDEQGDIQLIGLGRLHVEGLTKMQMTQLLNEKFKDKLNNPTYAIRFLNYKVTVQGEVNHAGEINVPNERVTILEAIALAGDITIYAKKNEVLVVREFNGERVLARVDPTNPAIFNSPYYYLKQNDLVIVEPVKRKPSAGRQETIQNISIVATLLSMVALVYSILK